MLTDSDQQYTFTKKKKKKGSSNVPWKRIWKKGKTSVVGLHVESYIRVPTERQTKEPFRVLDGILKCSFLFIFIFYTFFSQFYLKDVLVCCGQIKHTVQFPSTLLSVTDTKEIIE